jgi:hypothetical protein
MTTHIKDAALKRYGVVLTDRDLDRMNEQCRTGRHLLRSFSNATEHHEVFVHGIQMVAVFRGGEVVTVFPRHWLRGSGPTALAVAFRKAGVR